MLLGPVWVNSMLRAIEIHRSGSIQYCMSLISILTSFSTLLKHWTGARLFQLRLHRWPSFLCVGWRVSTCFRSPNLFIWTSRISKFWALPSSCRKQPSNRWRKNFLCGYVGWYCVHVGIVVTLVLWLRWYCGHVGIVVTLDINLVFWTAIVSINPTPTCGKGFAIISCTSLERGHGTNRSTTKNCGFDELWFLFTF